MFTKQNTAVLPVVILMFGYYFFPREQFKDWKYSLPFFVAPVWVALKTLVMPVAGGKSMTVIGSVQTLSSQEHITPLKYLVTEFSVIWLYIRLLFLPFGQALDYGYPVVASVFVWRNLWPLLGILALLGIAVYLRKRRPLVSFGILWFFVTLAVESTLIPLDPVFEHRLYIPKFGFALVVIDLLRGLLSPRQLQVVLILVVFMLGFLAWQRNALWNDPVALYEDNLRQAPQSERVSLDLAKAYMDAGRDDDALRLLERAVAINASYDQIYVNLSKIYIERGALDQAMAALQKGLALAPSSRKLLDNLGTLYDELGQPELAIRSLERALMVAPNYPNSHLNLGVVYAGLGRWPEAIASYQKAIALSHEYPVAHFNLGVAYYNQNNLTAALQQTRIASDMNPDDAAALFNLAIIALELGDKETAVDVLPRLRVLDSQRAMDLESEIGKQSQR